MDMKSSKSILLAVLVLVGVYPLSSQWIRTSGPEGGRINDFAVVESYLFAAGDGGVFRSSDEGSSWTDVNNEIGSPDIFCMAVMGTRLFVGGNTFLTSTNHGMDRTINTSR